MYIQVETLSSERWPNLHRRAGGTNWPWGKSSWTCLHKNANVFWNRKVFRPGQVKNKTSSSEWNYPGDQESVSDFSAELKTFFISFQKQDSDKCYLLFFVMSPPLLTQEAQRFVSAGMGSHLKVWNAQKPHYHEARRKRQCSWIFFAVFVLNLVGVNGHPIVGEF